MCGLCACWLLMVDLHITDRLLIGMHKKLEHVETCFCTPVHKPSDELMWCVVRNDSKARWGPVVFLTHQHECYSIG